MISFDPPLHQGTTTDWINPIRGYDADELLRFQEDPDNAGNALRFARHLLDRDHENIWALKVLASSATTSAERTLLLREVVRVGLRVWRNHLTGQEPSPNWLADTEARLFLLGVSDYGLALGQTGKHQEAQECLQLVTRLDPNDRLGAVAAFKQLGIVVEHGELRRPGPRQR